MINPCAEIMLRQDNERIIVMTVSIVDNEKWYTIAATREIAAWIRSQDTQSYYEHPRHTEWWSIWGGHFDVHNELMLMLKLKSKR
jgi:hypothetical protein